MKINESNITILLISILIISTVFKKKDIFIPENHITIIDYYQKPLYAKPNNHRKGVHKNLNTKKDTTAHSIILNNVKSDFGKNWMKRYSKGIKFEFYPPN